MVAHREGDGEAEVHETMADFFVVESGEATLVVGGQVVGGKTTAPNEIRGPKINGGERRKLAAGDIVHIPVKTPHQLLVENGQAVHVLRDQGSEVMRLAAALVGICFLALLMWTQRERILTGRNDFSQLYVGAKLSGSGQLYDRSANIEQFKQTIGVTMEGVLYSRLPFYAFLLRPLAALPYMVAFALFAALNLADLSLVPVSPFDPLA